MVAAKVDEETAVMHQTVVDRKGRKRLQLLASPRIKAEVLLRSSLNVTEEIAELISTQGILLGVWMFKSHRFNTVL
ncbi:hypothetical protein PC119_g25984 [Phytophthora cactorum]|nr:hypothetical protein PC119_g25984 [Phytophthora cactorum]